MSVTWHELLDAYETDVAAIERAVAAGEAPPADTWEPPTQPPVTAPTEADRERFAALQQRADACVASTRQALADAGQAIEAARRTGRAARAYGATGPSPE